MSEGYKTRCVECGTELVVKTVTCGQCTSDKSATADHKDNQERFEEWCDGITKHAGFTLIIAKDKNGVYISRSTRMAWFAWSARDAEVRELKKALEEAHTATWSACNTLTDSKRDISKVLSAFQE